MKINIDIIRPIVLYLRPGYYMATLVEIEKFTAKSGKYNLRWWWRIVQESSRGDQIASYTGNGTKNSHPLVNRILKEHLKALSINNIANIDPNDLSDIKVKLKVEESIWGSWPEVVSVLPMKYQYE